MNSKKLAESFLDYLVEDGFTHCFFLAGGNIMHLLDAARTRFTTVPFVHEVSAVIASECFNHSNDYQGKAFALVTAGPGLTNAVTGIAGAWLESREILVLGGQVKTSDLKSNGVRQLGIQELDGVTLVDSITKLSRRIEDEETLNSFLDAYESRDGRPGPIFMEWCLDAQAKTSTTIRRPQRIERNPKQDIQALKEQAGNVKALLEQSTRPVILIGGGLSRPKFKDLLPLCEGLGIPLMFTWNAADYLPENHFLNFGRPNTWGQLSANLLIQQSDLILSIGSRLGLQQTGFAWQQFAPVAKIIQVDIDDAELSKGRPRLSYAVHADAAQFFEILLKTGIRLDRNSWIQKCKQVRNLLPKISEQNSKTDFFIQPQELISEIGHIAPENAAFSSSSSGGTFTVTMQTIELQEHQRLVSNKALASMGYGTAAAIGLSLADTSRQVVSLEGDGGFAQNLQELGTASWNQLNVKFLIFSNSGYASIRMTQKNYFNGNWIGCDSETGLGLPDLKFLAQAYGIAYTQLEPANWRDQLKEIFDSTGPHLVDIPVDPAQTYLPKIGSRVLDDGSMASNPLDKMQPDLSPELQNKINGIFESREK
jgi:acetolactate synthase-1/2/3 large subunit